MAAAICCIVPEPILYHVLARGDVPEDIKAYHRYTLDTTKRLRRVRQEQTLGHTQPHQHQGIVPPHVHSALAQNVPEEREAALRTLEHDTEARGARAPTKSGLNRTIYDAQHTEDENDLPGDVVLIREGGPLVPLSKDPSGDPNEAYNGFKATYDFYKKFFNRNSLNNMGMKLVGSVHFGVKYQNAFWDGREMVFGDGDGRIFRGFTDELDVIGHELTHGVVQYTCNLNYENQSGALNEHLADAFGIMIKQWTLNQAAAEADWVIAEGIWGPSVNGRGLRDMKAPGTAYDDPQVGKDPQPATMADYQDLPNNDQGDYGGVHINSGIPNHAFYLAATKIGGNSWEGAGPIWYKTMTDSRLKSDATFQQFADLTVANAGGHTKEVTAAWEEVGITVKAAYGTNGYAPKEL